MILKWICFLLICLDTVGYIIRSSKQIETEDKMAGKLGRLTGMCAGVAARVYVLYGAGTCWLTA